MPFWKVEKPKRYGNYEDMPSWLLALFGAPAFLIAIYCGYAFGKILPMYVEIANKTPFDQWGLMGWLLTAELAVVAVVMWYFGSVAFRCNKLLLERWFK